MTPRVVWPAPGYPHVCTGDGRNVRVIVAHRGELDEPLRAWGESLFLKPRAAAGHVTLALRDIARPLHPPEVAAFAESIEHAGLQYAELRFEADAPLALAGRRSAVFDLVSARQTERCRSVAWFARSEDLRLAIASDLHVAALWDDVAEAVQRHAPDLGATLAHPSAHLRRFVDDVNRLAGRGEADAVVFTGDLVDHVYTHQRAHVRGGFDETNVSLLWSALDRLEVPSFVIPGNHDYRLYPWRLRAYGLHAARVPKARLRTILERAGWWDRWPLRWSDLQALATNDEPRAPLHHYLMHLTPSLNHDVQIGTTRLVFLDSGRDIVPRWRSVDRSRVPLLIRSLPGSWIDPDSEGLSNRQVALLEAALQRGGGSAVFCHAPLLASHAGRIPDLVARLDVERFDTDLGFERWLARNQVRCGTLFRNPLAIVRLLRGTRAPLTWFAGHVHRRDGFSMRTGDGVLRHLTQPHIGHGDHVDFIQAPSLGLYGAREWDHPGYLLAVLRGGQMIAQQHYDLPSEEPQ